MPQDDLPSISTLNSAVASPVLKGFRLTPDHRLILQLQAGGRQFSRRIRLGGRDAGLFSYSELDGRALFARGRQVQPTAGACIRPHYPLRGELLVSCSSLQLAALAAEVWPVMRALAGENARQA